MKKNLCYIYLSFIPIIASSIIGLWKNKRAVFDLFEQFHRMIWWKNLIFLLIRIFWDFAATEPCHPDTNDTIIFPIQFGLFVFYFFYSKLYFDN